jgi:subtilisin-like proprotein convertase family protein
VNFVLIGEDNLLTPQGGRKATTMKKYTLGFNSILFTLFTAFLFVTVQGASALTVNFTNPSPITIPLVGNATPYPATVNVIGLSGPITDVNVTLTGLSHEFINDVGVLLVGPGGQSVVLFDGIGGNTAISATSPVNIVLDDQASQSLPAGTISSGTFKPTNLITSPPDVFPPPAPGSGYGSLLSGFNGTSPNGTWRLFIEDFSPPFSGSVAGGFGLQITARDVPEPASVFLVGLGFLVSVAWLRRREIS